MQLSIMRVINIPALLVDEKMSEEGKFQINEQIFNKMIAINQKGCLLNGAKQLVV